MWVYFNNQGTAITNLPNHGNPARQGVAGSFEIFAVFQQLPTTTTGYTASISFRRPDFTVISTTYNMTADSKEFELLDGETASQVVPFVDGQTYPGFKFVVNDPEIFGMAGTYTITIKLFDGTTTWTMGMLRLNVQPEVYTPTYEITQTQYEALEQAIAGKQDVLPTVVNDRYLHTNSSTGALEWSTVSGGTTYTAGTGIDITNNTISVDTDTIATKSDLSSKQDTLPSKMPNQYLHVNLETHDLEWSSQIEVHANKISFPTTGDIFKLYVDNNTNQIYRWKSNQYIPCPGGVYFCDTTSTTDNDVTKALIAGKLPILVVGTSRRVFIFDEIKDGRYIFKTKLLDGINTDYKIQYKYTLIDSVWTGPSTDAQFYTSSVTQRKLTAGTGIDITNNTISVTGIESGTKLYRHSLTGTVSQYGGTTYTLWNSFVITTSSTAITSLDIINNLVFQNIFLQASGAPLQLLSNLSVSQGSLASTTLIHGNTITVESWTGYMSYAITDVVTEL